MGTKVHCKSYLPGYYSMRDLNEDSSSSSWPLFYGDNPIANGQYYNGFMPRNTIDGYPGYDKDALKQKMLEHEAVFKRQVFELHRLYRIQREMMEEVKRKEVHTHRASIEPSSSSSLQGSRIPSEEARKWHMAGFPLLNSGYGRTSVSGVEIVNSPMSCSNTKRDNTHFPFQNGPGSKESEALDSRPLKVRKKLFDLQLPADEYIDTEEGKKKLSGFIPNNGSPKGGPESSMKLSIGGRAGLKNDCRVDVPSPRLRNSTCLADLNEPVQIEESVAPSSVDFLGNNCVSGGVNRIAVSGAGGHLGVVAGETVHIRDGFLVNSPVESKFNEKGHLSHIYEAGSSKSNLGSVTQNLRQDNFPTPSHPMQSMLNSVHHPSGTYPVGYKRDEFWRDRTHHDLESSSRNHNHSNNNTFLEPLAASQPQPFFGTTFASSWANSVSSWAKPTGHFTQNINPLESGLKPSAETDRSFQPPPSENSGVKSSVGCRWNPGSGNEVKTANGFYHGSASGSKDLQTRSPFEYPNNHGFGKLPNGICPMDSKPVIDLNEAILQDLNLKDGQNKPEDKIPVLPWLKPKTAAGNDTACTRRSELSSSSQLCCKNEPLRDLNQLFAPNECDTLGSKGIPGTQNVKKILGVPIFETGATKNEPSVISSSASIDCLPEGVNNERRNRIIDINLEYEPDEKISAEELVVVQYEEKTKESLVRDHIDLNSCISECEDPLPPSDASRRAGVKMLLDIDLEAPVFPESEDDSNVPSKDNIAKDASLQSVVEYTENKQIPDEILRNAAETIFAISSSCPEIPSSSLPSEAELAESLLCLVDAVSSLENPDGSEIDDFEAMTLQLEETKEEDYMPVPFVPEFSKAEEAGPATLPTRSRRGQSRRGRQRRDFQRDILPGLASLSRHEVTEDLQTFGGMMRATGHVWNSGLTRRNGSGRGRRRAVVVETVPIPSPVCVVQQISNIEASLEDRSLTGWGKTTRRPRRQRVPAGNQPTVVLT